MSIAILLLDVCVSILFFLSFLVDHIWVKTIVSVTPRANRIINAKIMYFFLDDCCILSALVIS